MNLNNSFRDAITPAFCVALAAITCMEQCTSAKVVDKCQKEIKEAGTSAADYDKIAKQAKSKPGLTLQTITWQKACDSIKAKGMAEKAYLEGQQLIRDSLKAASKIKP